LLIIVGYAAAYDAPYVTYDHLEEVTLLSHATLSRTLESLEYLNIITRNRTIDKKGKRGPSWYTVELDTDKWNMAEREAETKEVFNKRATAREIGRAKLKAQQRDWAVRMQAEDDPPPAHWPRPPVLPLAPPPKKSRK
jgi:DNA-binding transcriptional ArsR family regulator